MSSPLYNALIGSSNIPQTNNNPMQILQQFNNFKKQMANINPEQEVKRMLANGQITQQQLSQLQHTAKQFQTMFNIH